MRHDNTWGASFSVHLVRLQITLLCSDTTTLPVTQNNGTGGVNLLPLHTNQSQYLKSLPGVAEVMGDDWSLNNLNVVIPFAVSLTLEGFESKPTH